MNVIISNKNRPMLQGLNIEVIQNLNGEFDVDYLVDTFKNFYFNRMILDITALKNYSDIRNLQKLSLSIDMDKVILVLDDSPLLNSREFLSNIISIGIYNFAKNIEGIMYLFNHPNTYRDVAEFHQLDGANTQVNNQGSFFDRFAAPENPVNNDMGGAMATRIIGFKNVTKQAGATTLVYLCKKMLEKDYSVAAIEVGKGDFRFFNDKELISATNNNASSLIAKNSDKEIILVDMNDNKQIEDLCHDVIYLVEPSTIKLNRIMLVNANILNSLRNKKVILNKSLLNDKDVHDFEFESRIKVFYNMPNLDDRANHQPNLEEFLNKLGLTRIDDNVN